MSESDSVNPSQLSTKLEAILYLKAQPLSIQELADYAICEIEDVEEALLVLMQDYALRDSALEVVESNAGFSLQLREVYMSLVQTIVPTDLGVGALRTLAAIALKGPIPQTQLVELRGSGAYQHVGDLAEEGFVSKRRQSNGRSYSVQVTEKFYQYFEVDELPKLKLKNSAKRRRVVEDDPEEKESTQSDFSSSEDSQKTETEAGESSNIQPEGGVVETSAEKESEDSEQNLEKPQQAVSSEEIVQSSEPEVESPHIETELESPKTPIANEILESDRSQPESDEVITSHESGSQDANIEITEPENTQQPREKEPEDVPTK